MPHPRLRLGEIQRKDEQKKQTKTRHMSSALVYGLPVACCMVADRALRACSNSDMHVRATAVVMAGSCVDVGRRGALAIADLVPSVRMW